MGAYTNIPRVADVLFGDPRIEDCLRLPGAYRSLPRPSSASEPSHPSDGERVSGPTEYSPVGRRYDSSRRETAWGRYIRLVRLLWVLMHGSHHDWLLVQEISRSLCPWIQTRGVRICIVYSTTLVLKHKSVRIEHTCRVIKCFHFNLTLPTESCW